MSPVLPVTRENATEFIETYLGNSRKLNLHGNYLHSLQIKNKQNPLYDRTVCQLLSFYLHVYLGVH